MKFNSSLTLFLREPAGKLLRLGEHILECAIAVGPIKHLAFDFGRAGHLNLPFGLLHDVKLRTAAEREDIFRELGLDIGALVGVESARHRISGQTKTDTTQAFLAVFFATTVFTAFSPCGRELP